MEKQKYTILQMAKLVGVDKQKVSRFLKNNHIKSVSKLGQALQYDETAKNLVITEFKPETTSNNDILLKQLEIKDQQIEKLSKMLENQQILTLKSQEQNETLKIELANKTKKHWWNFGQKKDEQQN